MFRKVISRLGKIFRGKASKSLSTTKAMVPYTGAAALQQNKLQRLWVGVKTVGGYSLFAMGLGKMTGLLGDDQIATAALRKALDELPPSITPEDIVAAASKLAPIAIPDEDPLSPIDSVSPFPSNPGDLSGSVVTPSCTSPFISGNPDRTSFENLSQLLRRVQTSSGRTDFFTSSDDTRKLLAAANELGLLLNNLASVDRGDLLIYYALATWCLRRTGKEILPGLESQLLAFVGTDSTTNKLLTQILFALDTEMTKSIQLGSGSRFIIR